MCKDAPCYLKSALTLFRPLMRAKYGLSNGDVDEFSVPFRQLTTTSEIGGKLERAFFEGNQFWKPGEFYPKASDFRRLRESRLVLAEDEIDDPEDERVFLRLFFQCFRGVDGFIVATVLLRLWRGEKYPILPGQMSHLNLFPIPPKGSETEVYLAFRESLQKLKESHGLPEAMRVCDVEHAIWVIWQSRRHGKEKFSRLSVREIAALETLWPRFSKDRIIADMGRKAMPYLDDLFGAVADSEEQLDRLIEIATFLERVSPRDAGKFYGEAFEILVHRRWRANLGECPVELRAVVDVLFQGDKEMRRCVQWRNDCVHPKSRTAEAGKGEWRKIAEGLRAAVFGLR